MEERVVLLIKVDDQGVEKSPAQSSSRAEGADDISTRPLTGTTRQKERAYRRLWREAEWNLREDARRKSEEDKARRAQEREQKKAERQKVTDYTRLFQQAEADLRRKKAEGDEGEREFMRALRRSRQAARTDEIQGNRLRRAAERRRREEERRAHESRRNDPWYMAKSEAERVFRRGGNITSTARGGIRGALTAAGGIGGFLAVAGGASAALATFAAYVRQANRAMELAGVAEQYSGRVRAAAAASDIARIRGEIRQARELEGGLAVTVTTRTSIVEELRRIETIVMKEVLPSINATQQGVADVLLAARAVGETAQRFGILDGFKRMAGAITGMGPVVHTILSILQSRAERIEGEVGAELKKELEAFLDPDVYLRQRAMEHRAAERREQ